MKKKSFIFWSLRLMPAFILLQTLYFKFSAAPESVYVFETLGLEPYGRILTGILELIAAILLIKPKTSWIGGVMGAGIMVGAIFSHITKLGIVVQGDGGMLFMMAIIVLLSCVLLVWFERKKVPILKTYFA